MMKVELRMLAGLWLALLGLAAELRAETAEAPKTRLTSPYGIPGQVPTEEVWTRFLAGSDLIKATNAMKVTNRLFDAEGNLDPKACAEQQAAVREALAEIPVSAGLWLYGSRCAELSGDRVLAEQSEEVLAALLEHALGGRRLARLDRPIRVLGENDIYAILELTGEQVLHQFYQVPVQGRYMRLMVGLYNPETQRESPLYFDFLDTFIQLADDQPELAYPEGRQQFALSLLEGMAGSAPADLARDFWTALRLRDRAARIKSMLDLREKGGDYPFWLGTMCILVTDLGCAEQGVEMMLPFAEDKHADAYVALAAAYADGRGVERDEAAARDMLAAANAEVGAPNAEIALQYTLRTVHNDPKLHPLVADNLRAAAKAGDPLASLVVALSLGDWEGSVPAEALPLLETASRAGLAVATGMIGRHYLEGGQPAKGLPLLQQAALAGDTAAASTLGTNYALGKHVERDWTKAREWLTRAAQDGNTRAMRLLAMDYQREPGPENALRVDRWLTSATVLGDLTAALELARFLAREPEGAREPRRRALLLFDALIQENDSDEARVSLAGWYLTAKDEVRAPEKAEPLLRAAAARKAGDARVMYVAFAFLGRLPGADMQQAKAWLEAGIDGDEAETAIRYASSLLYAQPEHRDAPRALSALTRWWEQKQEASALNELAWARCTSPEAEIFSAEESARLGPQLAAVKDTGDRPAWLDTVAACHAAAGQFEQAIEVQQGALAAVEKDYGADSPMAAGLRKRLERYRAGERAVESPPGMEN